MFVSVLFRVIAGNKANIFVFQKVTENHSLTQYPSDFSIWEDAFCKNIEAYSHGTKHKDKIHTEIKIELHQMWYLD